jgi:xanthine dehydrogenase accessory factor
MHEIATEVTRWLADGERIALATVVWAEGSLPRPLGSRMAVASSRQMAGSVSGGCVEGAVPVSCIPDTALVALPRKVSGCVQGVVRWEKT